MLLDANRRDAHAQQVLVRRLERAIRAGDAVDRGEEVLPRSVAPAEKRTPLGSVADVKGVRVGVAFARDQAEADRFGEQNGDVVLDVGEGLNDDALAANVSCGR